MTRAASCGGCQNFDGDPAAVERAFRGLASMGSGYGSVRGHDGLCALHGLYLPANAACADFSPAAARAAGLQASAPDDQRPVISAR